MIFWRRIIRFSLIVILLGVTVWPIARVTIGKTLRDVSMYSLSGGNWQASEASRSPNLKMMAFIRDKLPQDGLVLVFRQNDFAYYAKRRFVRHISPNVAPLYRAKTMDVALKFLQGENIRYLLIPAYSLPTVFNSQVMSLVADYSKTELIADYNGFRLFRLRDRPGALLAREIPLNLRNFLPDCKTAFPVFEKLCETDKFVRYGASLKSTNVAGNELSSLVLKSSFIRTAASHLGLGPVSYAPSSFGDNNRLVPGSLYLFKARVRGASVLTAFLESYLHGTDGSILRISTPIFSAAVNSGSHYREYAMQFRVPQGGGEYRISLVSGTRNSVLEITEVELFQLVDAKGIAKLQLDRTAHESVSLLRQDDFNLQKDNILVKKEDGKQIIAQFMGNAEIGTVTFVDKNRYLDKPFDLSAFDNYFTFEITEFVKNKLEHKGGGLYHLIRKIYKKIHLLVGVVDSGSDDKYKYLVTFDFMGNVHVNASLILINGENEVERVRLSRVSPTLNEFKTFYVTGYGSPDARFEALEFRLNEEAARGDFALKNMSVEIFNPTAQQDY